jgi:hypothetical protein
MSEELKKKLYNYEVNPPETTWKKIAMSLDEEINSKFAGKLYEYEVAPPINVWEEIQEKLEKEIEETYPSKLYSFEVDPPKETWKKISSVLDQEGTFLQISSKRKTSLFVRYAVAACIISIIAFATFKLIGSNSSENTVAIKRVQPKKDSSTVNSNSRNKNSPSFQQPASNNLPKERPPLAQAKISARKKSLAASAGYMTLMAVFPTPSFNLSSNFKQASLKGDVPGNCSVISEADRYLMFMNPDGYLIRISKKLAEALGCAYSNDNLNQYNQCQEQIKKWRDKIAGSPASSSPDNFMDVLDIIKSVHE